MEIIKTEKGSLSVLGGKTDMGKSTIACYDCAEQLRSGKSVIFVSYEYCQSIIYTKLVNHFGLRFDELFKLNVNIIDITQTIMEDFFTMVVMVDLSTSSKSFDEIKDALVKRGESIGVEARIQREEIFNKMHRI